MDLLVTRRYVLLFTLCLAWGSDICAQPVRFDAFTLEDGLAGRGVLAILQDTQGFLWIGTGEGLSRFDGYDFVSYRHDPDDSTTLAHDEIRALVEDADGNIWIAAGTTVHRMDRGHDRIFRYDVGGEKSDIVKALAVDGAGSVWATGSAGDLYLYDTAQDAFSSFRPAWADALWAEEGGERHASPRPLLVTDGKGAVWINSLRKGRSLLFHLNAASQRFREVRVPDAFGSVSDLHYGSSGRLWIAGGSLGWVDPEFGRINRIGDWPGKPVLSVVEDRSGALWIGSDDGIYRRRQGGVWERYLLDSTGTAALSNTVDVLYQDRTGAIWIGTRSWLYRFDPNLKPFEALDIGTWLPGVAGGSMVMAIQQDKDGSLWVGTLGAGLLQVDSARRQAVQHRNRADDPTSIPHDHVWTLFTDRYGVNWVGTEHGMAVHDRQTGRFRRIHFPGYRDLERDAVYAFADSPVDSTLWVTSEAAFVQIDPVTKRVLRYVGLRERFADQYLLPQDVVVSFDGTIWVSSVEAGLFQYDPVEDSLSQYPLSTAQRTNVWDLHVDEDHTIWMATSHGLAHLDAATDSLRWYRGPDVAPGAIIYSLLPDAEGRLWMGTSRGLSAFDTKTRRFRHFDAADGIHNDEFNRRAAFRGTDGEMLFGGLRGVTAFFPDHIRDNPHVPHVAITGIFRTTSAGTERFGPRGDEPFVGSYRDSGFAFEFAALNFTNPHKNRYRYRLEGHDRGWIEAGTRRRADYGSVPPGRYVFRVLGSNNDGIWNEEGAAVHVLIAPPWWQTRWARVIYVLLAIGAIHGIVRWRSVQLEWRNRELSRLVEVRTEEVERQKMHIEEQAEKLRELDRLKSRFFANISHEFRTPLTLTFGPLDDLLAGRFGSIDEVRPHLVRARRNGQRLMRLINQLLDLSRVDAGTLKLDPCRMDLHVFLRQRVAAFESLATSRGLSLHFIAEGEPFPHIFDLEKLETVVLNLLSNAVKFTPAGGSIRVSVRKESGGEVAITVGDTGVGIAPVHLPRLFDRFYQIDGSTTRAREGTGIGLALVKQLVELHGGRIEVESAVGVGTTFTVILPSVEERAASNEELSDSDSPESVLEELEQRTEIDGFTAEPMVSGNGSAVEPAIVGLDGEADGPLPRNILDVDVSATIVLIVEDNADMRAYIRAHLDGDFCVEEADDGLKGVARAREIVPDVVVSDVMMPGLDGLGLVAALKEDARTSHVPVLLLTAKADAESRIAGLETGADAYLAKPFHGGELRARVRNLIEQRRRLQAIYSRKVLALSPDEMILPSMETAFLERVRDAVEAHLGDASFGVDALADAMGMSRRQLHRKLERLVGEAPGTLLRRLRLERGAALLLSRSASVKEIAYQVGFRSTSSFREAFRETFGVSPSEYDVRR